MDTEQIRHKLEHLGKAAFWKNFDVITTKNKSTGTSPLRRHAEKGYAARAVQMSDFFTKSVPAICKDRITEKCVEFCCEDIRSFQTVAGPGFIKLAQEVINVGATYGRLPAEQMPPDATTVSCRCQEKVTTLREAIVAEKRRCLQPM